MEAEKGQVRHTDANSARQPAQASTFVPANALFRLGVERRRYFSTFR